ncbi:MAG: tetratricopeptide repeat protein, partial [Bacteroidota bacterium]
AQEQSKVRKLRPYIAAAAVIAALAIGLNVWLAPASPKQMADQYVKEHFQSLGITMGSKEDSLQAGLRLYSEKKSAEALLQFESIMANDPSSVDAKKYAGIIALNLKQYDKALKYFEELENYPGLQVNPGKLFHAITLMERGQSGDKELAKQLLMKVVEENLDGKKDAREWLKKF